MQSPLTTLILSLAATISAAPHDPTTLAARQNQNHPVPSGACCIAATNLKQDVCTPANG